MTKSAQPASSAKARPARFKPSKSNAQHADPHDLYQRSVQCVEAEIDFVDKVYSKLRKKKASLLREDFCGTANTSCEWVRRRKTNHAVGLDIDPAPMAWGIEHNISKLKDEARTRLELRQADVLQARSGNFDVVLAMNFSYWCFKQRATLLKYFKAVRASLAPDGIFFMDIFGGSDSMKEVEEPRKIGPRPGGGYGSPGFTYVWEHHKYDPISGDMACYIHFRFADGSELKRAFEYDWRLWTIPEIIDVLTDAGFSRSTTYWEGDDPKGGGNGIFTPAKNGEACPSFIAYIVAER